MMVWERHTEEEPLTGNPKTNNMLKISASVLEVNLDALNPIAGQWHFEVLDNGQESPIRN